MIYKLNTSNLDKLREFKQLFAKYGHDLATTQIDLREIDADLLSVIIHKASQMPEGVLVEDTTLEIDGASIGVKIKWLLDHLPNYVGHKAAWVVLLAYHDKENVYVYKGEVLGSIVKTSSHAKNGFGFDPVFLPEYTNATLAESKPDEVNARAFAVEAFIHDRPFMVKPIMNEWQGPWQEE